MADLDKYIEVVRDYGSKYVDWYLTSFSRPSLLSSGQYNWAASTSDAQSKIPIFLLFSVLIGATIGSAIPHRPPLKDRAVVAVTVIALWIFTSVIVYTLCRLMHGKGTFRLTLLTMLQVLAIVYVTSNFLTLLIMSSTLVFLHFKNFLEQMGLVTPGSVLLSIQFVLLVVYAPWALASVHGFKRVAGVLLGLVTAVIAVVLGLAVFAEGSC